MSEISARTTDPTADEDPDLARAREGDDAEFTRIVEPLRRELHAHCYRAACCVVRSRGRRDR